MAFGRTEFSIFSMKGSCCFTRLILPGLIIVAVSGVGVAVQAQTKRKGEIAGSGMTARQQSMGIRETVDQIMARSRQHDAQIAVRGPAKPRMRHREYHVDRRGLRQNPNAPAVSRWPVSAAGSSDSVAPFLPQPVGVTFLGTQISESGFFFPPDSMGAVGPTQVMVVTNGRIRVFDKTGVLGPLNADTDVFFSSVLPGGSGGITDPQARFDRLTSRWFVAAITVDTPDRVLIAVSSGPTITGAGSFTFFQFQHDLVGVTPNPDTGGFIDYDGFGVDANALYIGGNVFDAAGTSFLGTTGFVVRKSSVLGAGPIFVTAFRQMGTDSGPGPYSPRGVDNDDPAATEGYFIGVDTLSFSLLQIRRISNPGGTPTISGNISLTVPTTTSPRTVPALGSTRPLDGLDDGLFAAQLKKGSLWTAHNFNVSSAGVATGTQGTTGRNGSRFYEIINLSTTPSLKQSGTFFDSSTVTTGTARHIWIPTVGVSGQGHMVIGASVAAPTNNLGTQIQPSIAVGGRYANDALGTVGAATIATPGAGNYNVETVGTQRWGDYSAVFVDPNDDMTMWTFQEYCNATNSWGVRAIQLLAPPPAAPSTAAPSNIAQGASSVSVVVTGTSASSSGFFDPGPNLPAPGNPYTHINASATGGITVNSVTYTDPTHVTLNLNTTGASLGSQNITVTNPDGQSSTGLGLVNVRTPLTISSAASRKFHGGVGNFDINMPLSGTPGVECRSGNNTALIVTFSNNVVSGNAAVTSGTGSVSGAPSFVGNQMGISLIGITNAQTITVTLSNVTDEFGLTLPNTPVNMSFLVGDTGGNGSVNASDVSQTKSRIGQILDATNFRSDVNFSGGINASDASLVKSSVGTALP